MIFFSNFELCNNTYYIRIFFFFFVQVMTDLIQGEFMQLGAKETENERFAHYLTKTYRKTASLIANGLKAVSRAADFMFSTIENMI